MKQSLLLFLTLSSALCYGQTGWVYNTDIKRGNQNQYIYIGGEVKDNLVASNEKTISSDTAYLKLIYVDSLLPKKKHFIPTPKSAAKVGLIMMDSIINGKKVSIIKEDLNSPNGKGSPAEEAKVNQTSYPPQTGFQNVAIGAGALQHIVTGSSAGMSFPDDEPKPGEKLYPCKYCDMQRTIRHIKYIAKLNGEGYVEISKGVWMKTD